LVPLTSLTSSKVKFELHSSQQQAFDKMKKVMGTNKPVLFHLHTDTSDHQLGAVIMQDRKPKSYGIFFATAQYSSKAVYNHWENSRVIISY
jgi:hypothetical protein